MALILTTLTGCVTTKLPADLSTADKRLICKYLRGTQVKIPMEYLSQLPKEVLYDLRKNPSVQRQVGC